MAEKKPKKNSEETPPEAEAAAVEVEAGAEPAAEAAEVTEPVEEPAAAEPEEPPVEIAAQAEPAEPEPPEAGAVEEEPAEELAAEAAPAVEAEAEAVAEAAPQEAAAPAEAAAPSPQSGPKPKRKRLPRALRPQRSKKAPAKPATRKPIVRLEKPAHERGRRQERQGRVVSSAMDKTIVVKVDVLKAHPKYKKVVRRSTTFHAHDETNQANVGDVVRIVETRRLSKTKRWRLAEIVEAAK
jgi:small subunit ribosomal protein S17